MAKGGGTTRGGNKSNPRGLAGGGFNKTNDALESIADKLYGNGLTVDPGDAVYETAANLAASGRGPSAIVESIEGTTDYSAQATRDYVQVWSNNLNPGDAMRLYGADDMVRIPYGNRSLMDIINELRVMNTSAIYQKYK